MESNIKNLLDLIPSAQIEAVFGQDMCDIDPEFIGFIQIYEDLSKIIPKHFTIVDLGCGYNPQCFYFKDHKKIISVDCSDIIKFKSENCEIFNKTIVDFIDNDIADLDLNTTFAICSYVPPWYGDNMYLVKKTFKNVFTFYPSY